jgi:hypothetical protein
MSVASHNAGSFAAGDTIYLCGTITSEIQPPSSGSAAGGRITYDGDDSINPALYLDRGYRHATNYCVDINAKNYLTFQNMELYGGAEGFVVYNNATYITIKKNTCHGMNNRGVLLEAADEIIAGGASGDGNEIYNCGTDTAGGDITMGAATNVLISYNHLYGNGVDQGVDGVVVEGTGTGIIIEHNKVHDHYLEDGIDIKHGNGCIIRFNEVYGNRYMGVTVQMNSHDVQVYGNIIHDNDEMGIWIRDGHAGAVEVENIHIWSNLIYDNGHSGIEINDAGEGAPKGSVYIYNNVLANNGANPANTYHTGIDIQAGTNYYIKNNIFYNNRHDTATYKTRQIYIGSGQTATTALDNNQYYSADGSIVVYWGAAGDVTLATLIASHSQETNGFESDPLFSNPATSDYTLQAAADAIDEGANLGSPYDTGLDPLSTWPYNAQTLDQDNYGIGWDVGAYVFTGITPYTRRRGILHQKPPYNQIGGRFR